MQTIESFGEFTTNFGKLSAASRFREGSEEYCILLKKLEKNIGHRVDFRAILKKLTFEGYVLGGFWLPWQQI